MIGFRDKRDVPPAHLVDCYLVSLNAYPTGKEFFELAKQKNCSLEGLVADHHQARTPYKNLVTLMVLAIASVHQMPQAELSAKLAKFDKELTAHSEIYGTPTNDLISTKKPIRPCWGKRIIRALRGRPS